MGTLPVEDSSALQFMTLFYQVHCQTITDQGGSRAAGASNDDS